MYKILRQSYTAEFKQEAVRQVEAEGKPQAQVARELGTPNRLSPTGARPTRPAS